MKITGFNPAVITKDPEAVIAVFEALGFERTHNKAETTDVEFSCIRMKRIKDGSDAEAFRLDIVSSPSTSRLERDIVTIRINVDDFDEACALLKGRGFRELPGFGTQGTKSSKYAYFASPSGAIIDICQHIKDHN